MKFKGDVIITDPCYIIKKGTDDWDTCYCGENMSELGIQTYLTQASTYGDWSCSTFNIDTKEKLGDFCADAGMVGVFLLDEVLKYNPNFDYHINRDWTTTLIKDFNGDIEIVYNEQEEDYQVVGKGNVNFYTRQTGF